MHDQLIGKYLPGNRLTLLNSGVEYFPTLLAEIDGARHDIFLETYIFADDVTGRAVATALSRAAQRGVTVRLLVDGFGGREFENTLLWPLAGAGVQVLIYRPEIARMTLHRRRLRRLHRKISVIDDRVAFVGGINIIDDYDTPFQTPPRFDFGVRIEGPLLLPIAHTVRRTWEIVVWANFQRRFRLPKIAKTTPKPVGHQTAAFVVRDNIRHRRAIEEAYLQAVDAAHDYVLIANAYFLPGRKFRASLLAAAERGVSVVIMLQGRVEYRLLHYATQALYEELLAAGVRIFEYHKSFLHAKVATIDDVWATVGSSNIDPFSLLLSKEANIVVRDARFARELRHNLQGAMASGAHELLVGQWRRRWWGGRLLQWASYQVSRLLIGVAGYGEQH
jgi:cardiolipin synthase A/B